MLFILSAKTMPTVPSESWACYEIRRINKKEFKGIIEKYNFEFETGIGYESTRLFLQDIFNIRIDPVIERKKINVEEGDEILVFTPKYKNGRHQKKEKVLSLEDLRKVKGNYYHVRRIK